MMRLVLISLLLATGLRAAPAAVLLTATEAELQPLLGQLIGARMEKVAALCAVTNATLSQLSTTRL